MFYNTKKCKHLHVESHGLNQEYTMKVGQESTTISKVDSEKDLGITVDKSLKFTDVLITNLNKPIEI